MKKLVKISAVVLAVGLILCAAGAFWVNKDEVNPGMIYGIVEENLKLSESIVELEQPQPIDFSGIERKVYKTAGYGLDEFNTLEIYAENTDVKFTESTAETMRATLETGTLTTAIKNGTLYVQAICDNGEDGELIMEVPDIYKGGCIVNSVNSRLNLGSLESAMDMSFCAFGSTLEADMLSADNITLLMSGSSVDVDTLQSKDAIKLEAAASELKAERLVAEYITMEGDNSTIALSGIAGGFSAKTQMAKLELSFAALTGNISLDTTAGNAVVRLPKGLPVTLRHNEDYGLFTDRTNHAQNDAANDAVRYTMETNIKYGIVTVENLR